MDSHDLALAIQSAIEVELDGSLGLTLDGIHNSRQARRERFMCAIIAASGMDCASLDANVRNIAAQAEIFLRASDALEAPRD